MTETSKSDSKAGLLKAHFNEFFKNAFFFDSQNVYPLLGALFVNSIIWVAVLIKTKASTQPMPLRFNVLSGIEYVGPGLYFLQLPAVALLLLVLNTVIARKAFHLDHFLGTLLAYGSLFVQIVFLVAVAGIIVLNS